MLTACLLWACVLSVCAWDVATRPALWSTTPTLSEDVRPVYNFRSTSSYSPTMKTITFEPMATMPYSSTTKTYNPRKSGYWNEDGEYVEDENPIGVLPDPAPVGEPLILFALAFLYFLRLRLRKRKEKSIV